MTAKEKQMKREKSAALLKEYGTIVPGGVHSNFREPVYFERASGARLYDVDGNEYIDCVVNNGACILGHDDPDIAAEAKRFGRASVPASNPS
jgi:glutamate-1-semialdehyde 2,1-aminomutase